MQKVLRGKTLTYSHAIKINGEQQQEVNITYRLEKLKEKRAS